MTTSFENPAARYHPLDTVSATYEEETGFSSFISNTGEAVASFATYGIGGAAISASYSLVNTGIALGNAFGLKNEELDIEKGINEVLGANAAKYYAENKDLVDGVGFVASSFVPGMAGVKALRAFQAGSGAAKTASFASALRGGYAPSILRNAEAAIESGTTTARLFSKDIMKLGAANLWQEALETAAFTGASLAVLNQDPFINKDGLGYFQSFGRNFSETFTSPLGVAFIGGAGAINTAINYRKLRALESTVKETELLNTIVKRYDDALTVAPGDRFVRMSMDQEARMAKRNKLQSDLTSVDPNSREAINFKRQLRELDRGEKEATRVMRNSLNDMLEFTKTSNGTPLKMVENGATVPFKDTIFTEKLSSILSEMPAENVATFASGLRRFGSVTSEVQPVGIPAASTQMIDNFDTYIETLTAKTKAAPEELANTLGVYLQKEVDAVTGKLVLSNEVYMRIGEALGDSEEAARFVLAHELGHSHTIFSGGAASLKAFGGKASKRLTPQLSTSKKATKIVDQAEELSRMARPDSWRQLDALEHAVQNKAYADGKPLSDADYGRIVELYNKQYDYMYDWKEMMADTWAIMNDGIDMNGKQYDAMMMRQKYADVQNFLVYSGSQVNHLKPTKAVLDTVTQNLTDRIVLPTAGDYGKGRAVTKNVKVGNKVVTKQYVQFGQTGAKGELLYSLDDHAYNPAAIFDTVQSNVGLKSAEEMQQILDELAVTNNAAFAAWQVKGADGTYVRQIPEKVMSNDLPLLERILKENSELLAKDPQHFSKQGSAFAVADEFGTDELITFASPAELRSHIESVKKSAIARIKADVNRFGDARVTDDQLARFFNTHERYITEMGADFGQGPAPAIMTDLMNITEPRHIMLNYGRQKNPALSADALADVTARFQIDSELRKSTALSILGLEELPEAVDALSQGVQTADVGTANFIGNWFSSFRGSYGTVGGKIEAAGHMLSVAARKAEEEALNAIQAPKLAAAVDRPALFEINALTERMREKFFVRQSGQSMNSKNIEEVFTLNRPQDQNLVPAWEAARDNILRSLKRVEDEARGSNAAALPPNAVAPDNLHWSEDFLSEIQAALNKGDFDELSKFRTPTKDDYIIFRNKATNDYFNSYFDWLATHNDQMNRLNAANGNGRAYIKGRMYVPPVDVTKRPFVLFVKEKPNAMTGEAGSSMLFAQRADELKQMREKLEAQYGDTISIYDNQQIKENLSVLGKYDFESSFHEMRMKSDMRRNGVASNALVRQDSLVLDELENYMRRQSRARVYKAGEMYYHTEIAELQAMDMMATANKSIAGGMKLHDIPDSNYKKLIDTLLGKQIENQPPWLKELGHTVDTWISNPAITQAWDKMTGAFYKGAQTYDVKDFENAQKALKDAGIEPAFTKLSDMYVTNSPIDRKIGMEIVTKMNAVAGTLMLRLDPIASLVNAISLPVATVGEISNIKRLLKNPEIAKEFNSLTKYKLPGQNVEMPGSTKLLYDGISTLFNKGVREQNVAYYDRLGVLGRGARDAFAPIDEMVPPLGEGASKAIQFVHKTVDNIAKVTMADRTEKYVRYLAANMADNMANTLRLSQKEKSAFIVQFVNRVHGNYVSNQRPGMFQGVVGQAIGLFQHFQFNQMQQLGRFIAEGDKKAIAMVGAMQTTLFGLQGLPAWNFINEQVGKENRQFKDLDTAVVGMVGSDAAKFALYGIGSNALFMDLFNRGDMNPRTPTLVPTSIGEVPAISLIGKFLGNLYETTSKATSQVIQGRPELIGQTLLEGLAHNGMNRPLAGIAQVFAGAKTTAAGNVTYAIPDIMSGTAFVTALGARPIDKAIAVDQLAKAANYQAWRGEQLNNLGEDVKKAVRSGNDLDEGLMENFASKYAQVGGDIGTFNKWMARQYSQSTTSQFDKLTKRTNDPVVQNLMETLGGYKPDEWNIDTQDLVDEENLPPIQPAL